MGTLFDYLDWRGDLRFSEAPINEIDNLIFTQLSYVAFDGIVPSEIDAAPISLRDAVRQYLKRHKGETAYLGRIVPSAIVSLSAKAAKTQRYANVKMLAYTNHIDQKTQTQFSAVTFLPQNAPSYVAYRGTDDTLVGWKEDFNMSFLQPVPAQREAVEYLERVAPRLSEKFFVGGHSKGGNLAVYAAVKCAPKLQERILTVYNNDGPGFNREFIEGVDYQNLRGKIRTIVPASSVVGMLLEHEETYEVIKSHATGLMQHDGCSWEVLGGKFIYLDTVTNESRLIDSTLREWLDGLSMKEREKVVDSVYEVLVSTNATTLTELTADKVKLVKAWGSLDPKVKSIVLKCIGIFLKQSRPSKKK